MTQDQITHYSELMAKFDPHMIWYTPPNKKYEPYWRLDRLPVYPKYFRYHKSYDWLHRVWVKFRDLKFDNVDQLKEFKLHKDQIAYAIAYWSIEEAFLELGRAIEWYNQIKK